MALLGALRGHRTGALYSTNMNYKIAKLLFRGDKSFRAGSSHTTIKDSLRNHFLHFSYLPIIEAIAELMDMSFLIPDLISYLQESKLDVS